MSDFLIRPLFYLISIDSHHDVIMVTHDGIGTKIDVYRILKAHDLVTSPQYVVMSEAYAFQNSTRDIPNLNSLGPNPFHPRIIKRPE